MFRLLINLPLCILAGVISIFWCVRECGSVLIGLVVFAAFLFAVCVSFPLWFFFASRERHTRCPLVTGVQTCALPIFPWCPLPALCVPAGVTPHDGCRVSPFGHPRIKA